MQFINTVVIFLRNLSNRFAKNTNARTVAKFGFVYSIFFFISFGRLDPDFGWHLQSGNYFIKFGIPEFDVFTYTASDFRWINHEWLNDVLLSAFFSWGGYLILSIVYAFIWSISLFVFGHKSSLVALILAVSAMLPFAGIRPLAWSTLFFALLLSIGNTNNHKYLKFVPLLFLIWVNIHGGFIAGLALVFYYTLKYRQKIWFFVFAISVATTLVNPYGHHLYTEIVRTMSDSSLHQNIVEWMPLNASPAVLPFVIVWAAGFIFFEGKKVKSWINPGPILFIASMSAARNIPLFVVATVKDIDMYFHRYADKIPDGGNKKIALAKKAVLGSLIVFVVVKVMTANIVVLKGLQDRELHYPRASVSYLKAHGCEGKLFNDYNYGGYLIWKLPEYQVYIDGRMPSWRDPEGVKYFDRANAVINDPASRESEFVTHNVRCVLVPKGNKIAEELESAGWKLVIEDNYSVLLIASDSKSQ